MGAIILIMKINSLYPYKNLCDSDLTHYHFRCPPAWCQAIIYIIADLYFIKPYINTVYNGNPFITQMFL